MSVCTDVFMNECVEFVDEHEEVHVKCFTPGERLQSGSFPARHCTLLSAGL